MDKSCPPPSPDEDSSAPPNPNHNNDHFQFLNQLNKISYKISKPPIRKPSSSTFDHQSDDDTQSQPSNLHQQQQQQQPPVYNINKNDFREVVQKLTGSPAANENLSAPSIIQPPKKNPSSRLQRIRPPPLAHLSTRSPPLLNDAVGSQRPAPLFSPLPPLPAVHAAAESPISAYMRYFQTSSTFGQPPAQNSSLSSPTSGLVPPPLHFPAASSPMPFGCLPSPGSLFSAVNQFGFQQFPLSPTPPVSSPRWKSH